MGKRSIRLCECGAPAACGSLCFSCCREYDSDHLSFIDWDAPCEDPLVHDSSYPPRGAV